MGSPPGKRVSAKSEIHGMHFVAARCVHLRKQERGTSAAIGLDPVAWDTSCTPGMTGRAFDGLQVDVINRGYSGYNTRWVKHIVPQVFPVSQKIPPELVTIFFGANDAALPDRLR